MRDSPAFRAFEATSWWNTPLPADAKQNPSEAAILEYLRSAPESGPGCLVLAGSRGSRWGQPIYWARPSDPEYNVRADLRVRLPELATLRIPEGARPASSSDGNMTVFDRDRGYVVALTDARYSAATNTWEAGGATVTYLASNGLNVDTGRSDDPRNRGTHRGNNGATAGVSWAEVRSGSIRHVLKVAAGPELANRFIFPMTGSDGDYTGSDPAVPPEGLRLRIKPDVDLDRLHLAPDVLVIARALQRYGFYIGDSGGATALKLEDTVAEGRGRLWTLDARALCGLPFTPEYWDVVAENYDPTR
jgi:hypothetical protein